MNIVSLLNEEELNKKMFFPEKYRMDGAVPVKMDETSTLYCKYVPSPGAEKTVVLFYGNGECALNYAASELVEEITGFCRYHCFIVEYRGYGMSTGKLTLVNVLNDVKRVIAGAGVEEKNIVIFGRSLGGFSVIEALSHFPDVAGVIMESAYSCLSEFVAKRWNVSSDQEEAIDAFFNYREKIANFHGPVLLIHGIRDDLVPYRHCEALGKLFFKQTGNVTTFIARGGHNNIFPMNSDKYLRHVRHFLASLK